MSEISQRAIVLQKDTVLANPGGISQPPTRRQVQDVLDAIEGAGCEINTIGHQEIVEKLTKACPLCEGSMEAGDGDFGSPPCKACVWGRVPEKDGIPVVCDNCCEPIEKHHPTADELSCGYGGYTWTPAW